ncbi:FAM81B isoform 6, partial [Pan troglodytes]
ASPTATAEEQPVEPDGPLPGSDNNQEKKVRLSPAKMSTKNSTDLVEYVDKGPMAFEKRNRSPGSYWKATSRPSPASSKNSAKILRF